MPPRPPLTVVKLSDHFGQYVLILTCACGHTLTAQPQTLAALVGWDALLADIVKRGYGAHNAAGGYAASRCAPRRNAMGKTDEPP